MVLQPLSRKWTAAFVAVSLLGSSTAQAAAASRVDPLVALSVLGSSESRAAVCAAGASAAAAAGTAMAAQAGTPGCVLPVVDTPPPVAEAAPPPVAAAPVTTGAGVPVLPLLLGLAAIVAFAALVLHDENHNGEINLPISP